MKTVEREYCYYSSFAREISVWSYLFLLVIVSWHEHSTVQ